MTLLTVPEIITLHDQLIATSGGMPGIRDCGLLESAVASADASFDDVERYPSILEKAARLAYAITMNHAFTDGNKRIGIFVMLVTLDLNGINLSYTQKELIALGLGIADGSIGYDCIFKWIGDHDNE